MKYRKTLSWTDEDILIINKEIKSTYKLKTEFKSSLEEAKCFVTDCENLIAGDGSILISSNQIHEKKLDNFPENFIIISDTRKLKNESSATKRTTVVKRSPALILPSSILDEIGGIPK